MVDFTSTRTSMKDGTSRSYAKLLHQTHATGADGSTGEVWWPYKQEGRNTYSAELEGTPPSAEHTPRRGKPRSEEAAFPPRRRAKIDRKCWTETHATRVDGHNADLQWFAAGKERRALIDFTELEGTQLLHRDILPKMRVKVGVHRAHGNVPRTILDSNFPSRHGPLCFHHSRGPFQRPTSVPNCAHNLGTPEV